MSNDISEHKGEPMKGDDGTFINISTVDQGKDFKVNHEAISHPKVWSENIFNELNKEGYTNPKAKDEPWSSKYYENNIELIQYVITFSSSIYEHLNSKGLINKGFCPITGDSINSDIFYQLFGRKVFLSSQGIAMMKEFDRKESIKLTGKEPLSDSDKQQLVEDISYDIKERRNGRIMLFMFALILILLLLKYW